MSYIRCELTIEWRMPTDELFKVYEEVGEDCDNFRDWLYDLHPDEIIEMSGGLSNAYRFGDGVGVDFYEV